jgi:hypothetical protein
MDTITFWERKHSMQSGKKIINFVKKAVKITDRTQEEISQGRKQKRNEILDKLRKNKKL